jgi:Leucine Rich repeat
MQDEPPKAAGPKRKRRWFQFSLRSLIIFTLVCAVAAGWLGRTIERARRQTEGVAKIRSLTGAVKYDYELTGKGSTGLKSWLSSVFGDDFVYPVDEVSLSAGDTRDADLACLADLPTIKTLALNDTEITDIGLAYLAPLESLDTLDISNIRITDAGLKHVARLRNLRSLRLRNDATTYGGNHPQTSIGSSAVVYSITFSGPITFGGVTYSGPVTFGGQSVNVRDYEWYRTHQPRIGDAGFEHLAQLVNLESLDLEGTDVTSSGISRLKGLIHLTYLSVRGTNVSEAAIADLKLALPKLKVDKFFEPALQRGSASEPSFPSFAPPAADALIDYGVPGQLKSESSRAR